MNTVDTPKDYLDPDFSVVEKVHGWRNYISEDLALMWHSFTSEQKAAIAINAQEIADREEWN